MSAYYDNMAAGAEGYGDSFGYTSGDVFEAAKMEPFTPAANGQREAWWERVAMYGLTRAVDNRFGPQNIAGNTAPGSFAGQNGRTYTAEPGAQRTAPVPARGGGISQAAAGIPGGWLTIGAGALLAWVAFKS